MVVAVEPREIEPEDLQSRRSGGASYRRESGQLRGSFTGLAEWKTLACDTARGCAVEPVCLSR